jgi:hypothetical protein
MRFSLWQSGKTVFCEHVPLLRSSMLFVSYKQLKQSKKAISIVMRKTEFATPHSHITNRTGTLTAVQLRALA